MKNCENCIHLEYLETEDWDPSGYVCNKRFYDTDLQEIKHQEQLEDEKYRRKPKKCCDLIRKGSPNDPT